MNELFDPNLALVECQRILSNSQEQTLEQYLIDAEDAAQFELNMAALNDTSYLNKLPEITELGMAPFNFKIELPDPTGKNNWSFSKKLNKAFIKMKKTFAVTVSYTNDMNHMNQARNPLYLRIMPIFTAHEDQHFPVKRCLNHQNDTQAKNLKAHIVTCARTEQVIYEGDSDEISYGQRLSLKLPLCDQTGHVEHLIGLEFHCQNSCASGMNRKSAALLFVLETEAKTIVGRRLMPFKICSCPKRDMIKEETQDVGVRINKRKQDSEPTESCKKIMKVEVKQEQVVSPPAPAAAVINGIQLDLVVPDDENCIRQIKEAAANVIASFIMDKNPENSAFWDANRKTLLNQQPNQL